MRRRPPPRTSTWRSSTIRTTTRACSCRSSPAIKIKSGKLLWLAGSHRAAGLSRPSAQARTDPASTCRTISRRRPAPRWRASSRRWKPPARSFKDVVHVFVFRTRPRMGDIGRRSRGHQLLLRAVQSQADLDQHGGAGAGRAGAADRDSDGCGGGLSRPANGLSSGRADSAALNPLTFYESPRPLAWGSALPGFFIQLSACGLLLMGAIAGIVMAPCRRVM